MKNTAARISLVAFPILVIIASLATLLSSPTDGWIVVAGILIGLAIVALVSWAVFASLGKQRRILLQ